MKLRLFLMLAGALLSAVPARSADWPQWRGPNRDGVSTETGLLKSWNQAPKLAWSYTDAGIGFSGPAIVGSRLYFMGCRGNTEFIICLDVANGKEVWKAEVGNRFDNPWGDGPRSTPTVNDGLVYALGAGGSLVCVDAGKGTEKWRISMQKDLKGQMMSGWGYTESVLVDGPALQAAGRGPSPRSTRRRAPSSGAARGRPIRLPTRRSSSRNSAV
jgi:outer membrane protein assembly factor BamB